MCVYVYVYVCTYIYIYIYIYMHTSSLRPFRVPFNMHALFPRLPARLLQGCAQLRAAFLFSAHLTTQRLVISYMLRTKW